MTALADRFPAVVGLERRVLDEAAKELLPAQASDWALIMTQATVVEYAVRRTKEHLSRFHRLATMVQGGPRFGTRRRQALEARDNLFPWIDYQVYRRDYRLPSP